MGEVSCNSKITVLGGGTELCSLNLQKLESNKPFKSNKKNYTLFVQQFNTPSTHKVIITRELGGVTATVEVSVDPNSSGTYSLKVGTEQFTVKVSDPGKWNKTTEKWIGGAKSF